MENKFKRDLIVGQNSERRVGDIFLSKGYAVEYNNSKKLSELKGWDFTITKEDKFFRIENKNDLMCKKTGNVAVEIKCVNNTISDYWVYDIDEVGIYVISINNLIKLINGNSRSVYGGDGGRSYMKLIKIDDFIKYCNKLC